ncbi:lipid IV(A) 3-deoxy-D-manno-octulosonic acid transferase [Psychromonas sp. SP041]|uniref:lipid IV(A) 3-deoxy-D-manno-octulosonic acid transferase n=1 Tax=Psychromonas sp. SP041 TaxID=1365007 RepID=UPI000426F9E6|nr:lipid IV(A) 3-deoxy-D-manno-octulosonic acid transferase [Psychromonas sp. SP041]
MRILYTLLLTLVSPFFLYSLYKSKPNKPKFGKRWLEHFGFTPRLNDSSDHVVWFHTVSVGETIAATPLIKAYHQCYPTHTIVVTTTTSTGAEQATKIGDFVQHRYMPVDFSWTVRRFITIVKPQKLFIMETELWPNTLTMAAQQHIEVTILNARLSERSFLRYKKFQAVFNLLSNPISQILCQTQADADRFIALGIATRKVQVTGSLKFDIDISPAVIESGYKLRESIGINRPVWIVASTHQGEDDIILSAHKKLLEKRGDLLLIIVPRHPERFDQVAQLSEQQGLKIQRRTTTKQAIDSLTQVFIGDTMGEMLTFIGAADICFMGGSLIGEKVGGHNLLEPAALAKPCLTGPSYYNFKLITEQLLTVNACTICNDSEAIITAVEQLIGDKNLQLYAGDAALQIVNTSKGALQKTLQLL